MRHNLESSFAKFCEDQRAAKGSLEKECSSPKLLFVGRVRTGSLFRFPTLCTHNLSPARELTLQRCSDRQSPRSEHLLRQGLAYQTKCEDRSEPAWAVPPLLRGDDLSKDKDVRQLLEGRVPLARGMRL